jgi:hypothetical protein
MENNKTDNFGVVTKEFATSFENAFLFISNPKNLPEWTVLFKEASDKHAVLETPSGLKSFGLVTHSSFETGVIDWFILSDQGRQVDRSYTRLHRLPHGHCVYSFMFLVIPLPGEMEEDAMRRQTNLIEEELERLKKRFEH